MRLQKIEFPNGKLLKMFNDRARKIYRIMFYIYGIKEPFRPNIAYLARLSTRQPNQVKEALFYLIENNLLTYNEETDQYTLMPNQKEIKKNTTSTKYFLD